MSYVCIGVPYWIGERQAVSAVDAIKASGFHEEINAPWIDITPDYATHSNPVIAVNRALADVIAAHPEQTPLVFAADCVSALGALKGLERHHPAVLWYDAHGDFNTPDTTPSGFLGGMPLAALVGRGNQDLMQDMDLAPVAEDDVIITDARDLDPEEGAMLAASKLTHLKTVQELRTVKLPDKALYLHFDTDIVDAKEMPAMNYPAPDGPSLSHTFETVQHVARDTQIVGVLFSLWNHNKDGADRSLANTLMLARGLVGASQK